MVCRALCSHFTHILCRLSILRDCSECIQGGRKDAMDVGLDKQCFCDVHDDVHERGSCAWRLWQGLCMRVEFEL